MPEESRLPETLAKHKRPHSGIRLDYLRSMPRQERLRAGFCSCETVFEHEERDVFGGEVFCPNCATRVPGEERYASLKGAQKAHPKARLYTGP